MLLNGLEQGVVIKHYGFKVFWLIFPKKKKTYWYIEIKIALKNQFSKFKTFTNKTVLLIIYYLNNIFKNLKKNPKKIF